MRRTSLFGLLWVVAAAPFALDAIILYLFYSTPDYTGFIMPRRDAVLYAFLENALMGDGTLIAVVIAELLWIALAVRLGYKAGFITKERMRFGRIFEEYPATHPGGRAGMAARVVIAALLALACFQYYSTVLAVMDPESFLLFTSSFGGPYGFLLFFAVLSIPLFPLVFSAAALIYSVITSRTLPEFRQKSAVTLAGIAVTGLSLILLVLLQRYLDLDKGLSQVPGVKAEAEMRALVILTDPPLHLPMKPVFFDINATPMKSESVPYSDANERAVREYLERRGNATCLRGTIYNYLVDCRMRELDAVGALKVREEALARTGDPGQGLLGIIRLLMGPASGEYKAVLKQLSGDEDFSAGGQGALRLGLAYARFGELQNARYWYEKGMCMRRSMPAKYAESYRPPAVPAFHGGRVSGRVTLDGVPVSGINVGVMTKNAVIDIFKKMKKGKKNISPFFDLMTLVDGEVTKADGSFSFPCLEGKDYALLLSIKFTDKKTMRLLGSPGFITVSKDRPIKDVGVVRLATK